MPDLTCEHAYRQLLDLLTCQVERMHPTAFRAAHRSPEAQALAATIQTARAAGEVEACQTACHAYAQLFLAWPPRECHHG